ncbi:hypothetical protein Droror1_Dr00016349 [Drosera rotundifolia]
MQRGTLTQNRNWKRRWTKVARSDRGKQGSGDDGWTKVARLEGPRGLASAGIWDLRGLRTTVAGSNEEIDGDGGWARGKRKEGKAATCWRKRGRLEKKIGVLGRAKKKIGVGNLGTWESWAGCGCGATGSGVG